MSALEKESLFISYCWSDGNVYADELEAQLTDYFDVKRDKSQLIANDDIRDFMAEIANCDNVLIVLTADYVKSMNCMLEVSYLLQQPDWAYKAMVLVVDETIYGTDRKIEILNYWNLREKRAKGQIDTSDIGKTILEEDLSNISDICSQLEVFLYGISRRKNPSQIAVVNELVRKKNKPKTNSVAAEMSDKEQAVLQFISAHKNASLKEISESLALSRAYTSRILKSMQDKKVVEVEGTNRCKSYIVK